MACNKTRLKLIGFLTAISLTGATQGVELNEPAGAMHGYPVISDLSGKKLANGEFRQWLEGNQLHVMITYKFPDGQSYEENVLLRQQPVVQEKWSWKESNNGKIQREFKVDFVEGIATAHLATPEKDFSEKIDVEPGRTFVGFGFEIALSNLHDRLVKGEQIELQAVGFTPKPHVVQVNISHVGLDSIRIGDRTFQGDNFLIHPKLPAVAKLFVHAPDHHIWLTNPAPATFLRWEGPIVLPSDPIVRVDFASGQ